MKSFLTNSINILLLYQEYWRDTLKYYLYRYKNVTPGTEFSVTLTLKSYLECHVTGLEDITQLVSASSPSATVNVVTGYTFLQLIIFFINDDNLGQNCVWKVFTAVSRTITGN